VRIANAPGGRATESEEPLVSDGVVRLDHQLLTAREVADLLRLPVSTVYELARTGRLPYLRIGRAMRFSQRDLEAHLGEARRAEPRVRRFDVG
jgi:excisionase family DNA binding protein